MATCGTLGFGFYNATAIFVICVLIVIYLFTMVEIAIFALFVMGMLIVSFFTSTSIGFAATGLCLIIYQLIVQKKLDKYEFENRNQFDSYEAAIKHKRRKKLLLFWVVIGLFLLLIGVLG